MDLPPLLRSGFLTGVLALASVVPVAARAQGSVPATRSLDDRLLHLGDSTVTTWPEVPAEPQGKDYEVEFEVRVGNRVDWVLFLTHRDVDNRWDILVNGKRIGQLRRGKATVRRHYSVPARALRAGKNVLRVEPKRSTDDIVIGRAELFEGSLREALGLCPLVVTVANQRGKPVPAKVTITKTKAGGGRLRNGRAVLRRAHDGRRPPGHRLHG